MNFVDAQEMVKVHPETFYAPSKDELDDISIGDFVKVCDNDERFWVIVEEIDGDTITGVVDNDLIRDHSFSCGSKISFDKCNVYNILS